MVYTVKIKKKYKEKVKIKKREGGMVYTVHDGYQVDIIDSVSHANNSPGMYQ